jgi:LysB family phage lysis regulatory protein
MSAILSMIAGRLAPWAWKLAALAIAVLVIVAGWFYVRELRAELVDAQNTAHTAQETVGRRDAVITDMQKKEREHAQALAQLAAKHAGIAAQLAQTERDFENLKNEKPEIRAWADSPLPDDIVRMYDRPARTGAGDESGATVRARDALHAAGDGTPR